MVAMHGGSREQAAALLERAYRMALVLQGQCGRAEIESLGISSEAFEPFAVASELVAVLDEARVALLGQPPLAASDG